jgi:hypothetical protein
VTAEHLFIVRNVSTEHNVATTNPNAVLIFREFDNAVAAAFLLFPAFFLPRASLVAAPLNGMPARAKVKSMLRSVS